MKALEPRDQLGPDGESTAVPRDRVPRGAQAVRVACGCRARSMQVGAQKDREGARRERATTREKSTNEKKRGKKGRKEKEKKERKKKEKEEGDDDADPQLAQHAHRAGKGRRGSPHM